MLKLTPVMGWNTWNTFGENINEKLIMETADKMVELGYKDAGYEYVIIDDCWSLKKRDENNRLVADPEKFPHGMKYLADYIHSKGLKFGMYSEPDFGRAQDIREVSDMNILTQKPLRNGKLIILNMILGISRKPPIQSRRI